MRRNRWLALVFVLLLSSCYSRIVNPYADTPDESCGVGRIMDDGENSSVEQWKSGAEEEAAPAPAVFEPEQDTASFEDVSSEPDKQSIAPEPQEEPPKEEEKVEEKKE